MHALQEAGQGLVKSAKKAAQSKVLHKYPASKRQHSNMHNAVKKTPVLISSLTHRSVIGEVRMIYDLLLEFLLLYHSCVQCLTKISIFSKKHKLNNKEVAINDA